VLSRTLPWRQIKESRQWRPRDILALARRSADNARKSKSCQPLGVLAGLYQVSFGTALGVSPRRRAPADEFRLGWAGSTGTALCRGPTRTRSHHSPPPVNSSLSPDMLPSTFLAAPVALSLLLPLASAARIGRRATTCNGFSDVCAHIPSSQRRTHPWVSSSAAEVTEMSPLSVRMTRTLSGSTTVSLHDCLD